MVLWRHGARSIVLRQNPGRAAADPAKVRRVMHEWRAGTLRSHGVPVTDYRTAVAIALAEGRRARRRIMSRPNPSSGGLTQILMLAGVGYILLRSPGPGQPSLLDSLTRGTFPSLTGSSGAAVPGQITLPIGSPMPAGYYLVRTVQTSTGVQQIIAPIPPGRPGYNPQVYGTATALPGVAATVGGLFTSLYSAVASIFSSPSTPTGSGGGGGGGGGSTTIPPVGSSGEVVYDPVTGLPLTGLVSGDPGSYPAAYETGYYEIPTYEVPTLTIVSDLGTDPGIVYDPSAVDPSSWGWYL